MKIEFRKIRLSKANKERLDVINPETLNSILETNIAKYIEIDKWNALVQNEKEDIEKLESLIEYL